MMMLSLPLFSPKAVLGQTNRTEFHNLPYLHLAKDLTKVEIIMVHWREEEVFRDGIPSKTPEF